MKNNKSHCVYEFIDTVVSYLLVTASNTRICLQLLDCVYMLILLNISPTLLLMPIK